MMSQDLDFYLDGLSKVSLFLYDNHTLIIENFNDEPVDVKLVCEPDRFKRLKNLEDGTTVDGKLEDYSGTTSVSASFSSNFSASVCRSA